MSHDNIMFLCKWSYRMDIGKNIYTSQLTVYIKLLIIIDTTSEIMNHWIKLLNTLAKIKTSLTKASAEHDWAVYKLSNICKRIVYFPMLKYNSVHWKILYMFPNANTVKESWEKFQNASRNVYTYVYT